MLEEYFEVIVRADDTAEHKPHPAPVAEALNRLSANAHETVLVGDSPYDVQSGRAAGVRTAAALWGPFTRERLAPHQLDYWLVHPREIITALASSAISAP